MYAKDEESQLSKEDNMHVNIFLHGATQTGSKQKTTQTLPTCLFFCSLAAADL